jgi:DNA polymerase I
MERRGVLVDIEHCKKQMAIGEGRMHQIRRELGGRNPNSNKDLYELFIEELKLPVMKPTPAGKPSFDKEAMEDYSMLIESRGDEFGAVPKLVLEYRGWNTVNGLCYTKFINKVSPVDNRLHCNYKLHGTKTGRTSCEDPNLQQTPKDNSKPWNEELKKSFITEDEETVLVQIDFSQGEMRLAAGYAKQENLIDTFKSGRSMWDDMIAALNRPKNKCKTLTYAKMYGAQNRKLKSILGGDDPETFINDWEAYHDKIVAQSKRAEEKAKRRGHVYLWTGRIRHLNFYGGPRKAYNSILQGGLAEIVKSAMIRLYNEVDSDACRMLLMVHDSVIFEIKRKFLDEIVEHASEVMSRVTDEIDFGVPFDVEHEFWGRDAS